MYSKPKGMYIKHRDRERRKLSPRLSDEPDGPLDDNEQDLEGRMSPRVQVQNYGEGNISPSCEPQWPSDFETEETQVKVPLDTVEPTDDTGFPERAKRYMVTTSSYKDLTGQKFITVPEPKKNKDTSREEQRLRSNSVRSYGQPAQFPERQVITPSAFVKPVARVKGTYRGVPANFVRGHSHIATIRLHSRSDSHKSHIVKPIPRDGTIRRIKSYPIGSYATLRPHNTKHLKHSHGPVVDFPRGGGFKRATILQDRKEYCFTQFGIELDRAAMEGYQPGDVLSGRITMEAVSKVEIRFVELLIIGLASVHLSKNDPSSSKHDQEIIINKRSYVMGTPDGRWNSLITPGKYVSKFRFVIPAHCPSTVKYNSEHGFSFEIGYLVKARICDEFGSSSARSTHSLNNYVKVLLSRRHPFLVRQPFDIHSIPRALQPVTHSEFVNLGCIPIFVEPTAINLCLDRAVFLAGDEVRAKLIVPGNTAHKIKSLTCNLQLRVQTSLKTRHQFNVVQIHEHDPEGLVFQQDKQTFTLFEFAIPTQTQFIPSFNQRCRLVYLGYYIAMTIKFKSLTGKLLLEYPIGIGPCEDPINIGKTNHVPLFIRPKRFPNFSKDSNNHVPKIQNGNVHSAGPKPVQVNSVSTEFRPRTTPSLLCCAADEEGF